MSDQMRMQRIENLKRLFSEKVLVLDGAMGTMIQNLHLEAKDFGGETYEGCNEYLNLTLPDSIQSIHEEYLAAGADIIETNTFGATPLVLDEFELGKLTYDINKAAALLARRAADKFDTSHKPRFVAGSIGPTTKAISVTGGISFDELVWHFEKQIEGLYDGGVDYLLIETCQDTRNIKAALLASDRFFKNKSIRLPIAVSGTIEPMGTMLAGQTAEALVISLMHRDLLYIGLNCATGPDLMKDPLRSLSDLSPFPIACIPNAGLPDEDGNYVQTPEMMAQVLQQFGEKKWINLIGGCCGTTPKHIKKFSELATSLPPRISKPVNRSFLSGIDWIEVAESTRPIFVGERTNVIGSRKFKDLVTGERWDEASEIARRQIKNTAQIIDICLANPDRDEYRDMEAFLSILTKKISTPLMIDSTDARVIEMALTFCQGKAIINSVNLEDGEERFEKICPLAKSYGAALVVGLIDDDPEQGMGVTRNRKIEIARRSFQLLTQKYEVLPEDIYWDALVFPCGTGDPQYVGSALETIEGLKLLKKEFPLCKTVLGISNVSFGLPNAGREVLNSVFLYHCIQSGLDLAIVNTEKIERFAEIPESEISLCDDLIWNRGADPVGKFNAYFGEKKVASKVPSKDLPVEERLSRAVIEGSKDGLFSDLDEVLKKMEPLEIINGPLMAGMDEVGRLFNANKLIVAEVLQSAEVMKSAVDHLKPHMKKTDISVRGRVVLATVKGDVHDIGKNLVEIILSNNGFEVINLGIKVPSQALIDAVRKHEPDILGLSGLLVKSAQQMVETAGDLASAGITTPILVGGAALTRNFVDKKIAPAYGSGFVEYANDAMDGLDLAKQIVDAELSSLLSKKILERRLARQSQVANIAVSSTPTVMASKIKPQDSPPIPPDWKRHSINLPLEVVWSYINPLMLLGKHLGLKGDCIRALTDPVLAKTMVDRPDFQKAREILGILEELKKGSKPWMKARGVYQFVPCRSEGNILVVNEMIRWNFGRQKSGEGLCLSDYVRGDENQSDDNIALFVTTCGGPIREEAEKFKSQGDYLRSHMLLSLALETAEAAAEYMHALIRSFWGFADSPDMTMMERFQAKYRGKRYSFGYPACPNLEFQKELFELLKPEEIGVELTEGFMMQPESSVSALVFSHPEAKYFSAGES